MTRKYSAAQKTQALQCLIRNKGNILLTAHQLNIPQRTLRDWRNQVWHASQVLPPRNSPSPAAASAVSSLVSAAADPPPLPPPPDFPSLPAAPSNLPTFADDLAALDFMRRQIMDELIVLSNDLRGSFDLITPYQRLQIVTQMLNQVIRLDHYLQPRLSQPVIDLQINTAPGEEADVNDH